MYRILRNDRLTDELLVSRVGFYRDHETNGGDYLGSAKRKNDAVENVTNEDVKPLNDHGTRAELCAKSDELVENSSLS